METKAHLKEVNELYRKISRFASGVDLKYVYSPEEDSLCYVREDIDSVIDALRENLDFTGRELDGIRSEMHDGKIDFLSLISEISELPEEEVQLLYILSRPFFTSMKNAGNRDNVFWQDGRCPVCGAAPCLSALEKESHRKYYCSFCGTLGDYLRIGCPGCLSENPGHITIITLEGEEGMRADTCEQCGTYFKTFEGSLARDNSYEYLDIVSIALDVVAQEKGFKRQAPNSVGLINML